MYSVRLNDGSVINNLELNGNNFIPETLDKTIFENNLEKVIITDTAGNEEERFNQKVQFAKIGDMETFILHAKTKEDKLLDILADLTETVLLGGV
jgi:hypothetical protein